MELSKHKKNTNDQSALVSKYYDEWNHRYMDIYGEVIQAYRPGDESRLLEYTAASAGLIDGMRILDAGCGVCGPAVFFAKNLKIEIDAITISEEQVNLAKQKISAANVQHSVHVLKGDYHFLGNYYSAERFDAVLFLESLGHSGDPKLVIEGAYHVLKPGGFIYIKDFFPREVDDPVLQERIAKTIANMNREYNYNTLDFHDTVTILRKTGFAIDFIKKPQFQNDTSVRAAFEKAFSIDVFEGGEFMAAEWLEIKCTKAF